MLARLLLGLVCVAALAEVADAGPRVRLRKPKRGFQMKVGAFDIQPGEDIEMCEYRRLPNKRPAAVSGFEGRMPPGAHHFVVWLYGGKEQDDRKFPAGPVERVGCTGLAPDELLPLVMVPVQQPNARFRFPKGVALKIEPGEQVWLNPHLKNYGGETITPDILFNFHTTDPKTVKHWAEGMVVGPTFFSVPPHATKRTTGEWPIPAPMTFIFLTTHQHQIGTYANIEIVREDGGRELIYENDDWEHPKNYFPSPELRLVPGEKLRITCEWRNDGDTPVAFGPETTDEMCFILGYYYRDDGDTAPITSPSCASSSPGLLCPFVPVVQD